MEANEERPSVPTASSANLEGIVVKMPSKAYLGKYIHTKAPFRVVLPT